MIIGITEVKAKNSQYLPNVSEYKMEWCNEYNLLSLNLDNNQGRGLILYVHQSLNAEEVKLETEFEENLFIKIKVNNSDSLLVGLIYRSPSENTEEKHTKLRELLTEAASKKYTHHLIMGDFNYPNINWELSTTKGGNTEEQKFLDCLEDNFLVQLIEKPTRWRGTDNPTTLDLIITGDENNIENIELQSPLGKSDHCVITFNFICQTHLNKASDKRRSYHKANYTAIKQELNDFNWENHLGKHENTDTAWTRFREKIEEIIEKHVPLSKTGGQFSVPLDKETLSLIKEKTRLNRKFINTKDEKTRKEYNRVRNKVVKAVRNRRKVYEKQLARDAKENPKRVWKYINLKSKTKQGISDLCRDQSNPKSSKTDDDYEKANILADFFSSVFTVERDQELPELQLDPPRHQWNELEFHIEQIAKILRNLKADKSPGMDNIHPRFLKELSEELAIPLKIIFEKSFSTGELPKDWKKARITAIFKKGNKSLAGNYRPVSLTSIVCKVIEKIIRNHIVSYMEQNKQFSNKQYGFTKGKSTSLQLLTVLDEWTEALDSGKSIDCIYMDYKKAFDTVPHKRLIKKLQAYGIGEEMVEWIRQFLSDREQQVLCNGKQSNWHPVTSGVPQGSVIGPLLFVIYINDLPSLVQSSVYLFADDTKVYKIIKDTSDKHKLQEDLERVNEWTQKWLLSLHPEKCKHIHIGKQDPSPEYMYSISGQNLEQVEHEKDIGVIVDKELKFEKHICEKVKKANSMSALIRRIFNHLDARSFTPLYKTLVRTHLDYASSVWAPWKSKYIDMIEGVQRRATKQLPELSKLSYPERLKKLKLPTLAYRRNRGDMIEVFKIVNGIYNTNENNLLKLNKDCTIREGNRGNSKKLYVQRARLDLRKHNFSIRVAKIWNSLPENVINANSLNSFKNRLDKFWSTQELVYNYKAEINTYTGSLKVNKQNEESCEEEPSDAAAPVQDTNAM